MARVTSQGLFVWDLTTDDFDHTELAANWDLVDSLLGAPSNSLETLTAIPTTGNFAGRLVMLSSANSGFAAWQLIEYNGSIWKAVGYEIQPTIPIASNYPGRIIILSAAATPFPAWSVIRFDGSIWDIIGGWTSVNTGSGSLNIQGVQAAQDVLINNATRGIVLIDRTSGIKRRFYLDQGQLQDEVVS